jgi:hypothetical protein
VVITNVIQVVDSEQALTTIYKLVCNDPYIKDVFVGFTTVNMKCILEHHERRYNSIKNRGYNRKIYQLIRANGGFSNWSIVILEKSHFNNREELLNRKKEWIEKTPNDVNMRRPITTPEEYKEYSKEYFIDNRVELLEKFQKHYVDNKVRLLDHYKEYYVNHKLEKKDYGKKYYEANKERRNENNRKRYEANKCIINENSRKRYIANKDIL